MVARRDDKLQRGSGFLGRRRELATTIAAAASQNAATERVHGVLGERFMAKSDAGIEVKSARGSFMNGDQQVRQESVRSISNTW